MFQEPLETECHLLVVLRLFEYFGNLGVTDKWQRRKWMEQSYVSATTSVHNQRSFYGVSSKAVRREMKAVVTSFESGYQSSKSWISRSCSAGQVNNFPEATWLRHSHIHPKECVFYFIIGQRDHVMVHSCSDEIQSSQSMIRNTPVTWYAILLLRINFR
jgi:hypothetical protein